MNARYLKRRIINYFNLTIASIAMFIGIFFLAWILISLCKHGFADLRLTTFTQITQPPGSNGGLLNAIVGSLLLSGCAVLLGTPIGMLAGIYLAEFGQYNVIGKIARFTTDILLSAPSIIIGLFIYEIIVVPQQHFSGWAGSFALAIIVIPIVIRTTENILVLIPNSLREAAAALGAPQWKVILYVLLRVARTGILTGILLATARISGETAPLLFTALNNQFWSINMNEPMANLPTVIFQYAMSPYQDWHQLAWSGALIITLWVLTINILIRVIFKQNPPLH